MSAVHVLLPRPCCVEAA